MLAWGAVAGLALFLSVYWFKHIGPKPKDIVSFELAGTRAKAQAIVEGWSRTGTIPDAQRSLWPWDAIFIPAYVLAIAGLCLWGRKALGSRWGQRLASVAAGAVVVAGAFDVAEDIALWQALPGPVHTPWPMVAALFAWPKFALAGFALLVGVAVSLYRAARHGERFLRGPSPGLPDSEALRQQVVPSERKQEPKRPIEAAGSAWRHAVAWLLGLPRTPAVGPPAPPPAPTGERTGICCSGGGIRSAAYNLGALQTLQQRHVLEDADHLAAVSGGSYIASSYALVTSKSDPTLLATAPAYAPGSPEETYLTNHSAYLGPPGVAGKLWMAVRTLVGVTVNVAFIAAIVYLVGRPLGWWYGGFSNPGRPPGLHPELTKKPGTLVTEAWMWKTVAVPAALGIILALGDLLTVPVDLVRRLLRAWSIRLVDAGLLALVLLIGLPWLVWLMGVVLNKKLPDLPKLTWPLAGLGTTILGALRALLAKRRSLLAMVAGAIVGPLTVVFVLVLFVRGGTFRGLNLHGEFVVWAAILAGFLIFYAFADLTNWSPHPFYKRALWSAFGLARVSGPEGPVAQELPFDDQAPLSELPHGPTNAGASPPFPTLVVGAAVNVSDQGATPPGRNAASFTFTPTTVGGPMVTEFDSDDLERILEHRRRDVSVNAAMAISGAAISPSMGKMTRGPIRFLMALLNVRLGVWLPNPLWRDRWEATMAPATGGRLRRMLHGIAKFVRTRPRPRYLVKEMMGFNTLGSKFLYVTDGGHYENLGLVELLRRECTLIYCFDASGDHEDTFYTLGEAISLAREELQVEITIDPDTMKPPCPHAFTPTDVVVGRIVYANQRPGILVFAKAAVTRDAPWDVRAFRQKDPRFPNHSTADQFFNEQKFEAYRALGAHTASRAVDVFDSTKKPAPVDPAEECCPPCAEAAGTPPRRKGLLARLRG